ncbi:hypothetical protein ACJMK2_029126 [Sinanodonta woodiana]|uniref:Uncharacterized protein n=1 Tax=Sinanodonta woodiana TaxID=1069815 RepID=A0ABD3XD28_SINWO
MFERIIAFVLFTLELYHAIGHTLVLFRIRMLPRKDLVRIRFYFLADALTVFSSSILFTGMYRWLAVAQIIQHMYYFLFWDKTYLAKKIINWSSLDWLRSPGLKQWELDSIIGTSFDIGVHILMAFCLASYLSTVQIIFAFALVQCSAYVVLFGRRFAWASPSYIPDWVEKRIQPIETTQ